jgi:choline dehydrogenase-like flavoprotein
MPVDYRALSNSIDLNIMVEIIKFMRRYMLGSYLKAYNITELAPGTQIRTDSELMEWARTAITPSVYHPVGTAAKMPREWGGVVDEELGVHGLKGLSVVDASIMPTIVSAVTQMTMYAVAEKVSMLMCVVLV